MKKNPIKSIKAFLPIILIAIVFPFQGCSNNKDDKLLTLGTSLDYPPFEFSQNGTAVGFDIDIAQALSKEMGYKLEIKDIEFSGLIPALKSGRVDFIMSGMSESEEEKRMSISAIPITNQKKTSSSTSKIKISYPLTTSQIKKSALSKAPSKKPI